MQPCLRLALVYGAQNLWNHYSQTNFEWLWTWAIWMMLLCENAKLSHAYWNDPCSMCSLKKPQRISMFNRQMNTLLKLVKKLNVLLFHSCHGNTRDFMYRNFFDLVYMSQLMRLWDLSHTRQAKAQASLRIRAVSPEPSLFTQMKYWSRRRARPKIRQLAPLDGCACAFEEIVYGGRKVP